MHLSLSFADQDHADAETFFYMLIVSSTVSSLYTLMWDLRMDWGLFDRGAGENTFLREEIVYPHKVESCRAGMREERLTCSFFHVCSGLLLLRHRGGRDSALRLDGPDFSDHNHEEQLCGGHCGHGAGSA